MVRDDCSESAIKSEDAFTFGTDLLERTESQPTRWQRDCFAPRLTVGTPPDDTDLAAKIQLLQVHIAAVHNGGGGQVRTPGSSDGTIAAA